MRRSLEQRLDTALDDITKLNESFEKLKDTEEYKKLDPKMIGEIENHLIESLLELAIYHINPKRGALPAVSKGGAK